MGSHHRSRLQSTFLTKYPPTSACQISQHPIQAPHYTGKRLHHFYKTIMKVSQSQQDQDFSSMFFVPKKKSGGPRPILDQNNWLAAMDMKDAYVYIPSYPNTGSFYMSHSKINTSDFRQPLEFSIWSQRSQISALAHKSTQDRQRCVPVKV